MVAYVVVIRERTKDTSHTEEYMSLAKSASLNHPITIRAIDGRREVVEGAPVGNVTILEFPTYEEAQAWYNDPAYQAAVRCRENIGEYHSIIVEGV